MEAMCGRFNGAEKGWQQGEGSNTRCSVQFPRRYEQAAKLLFGLSYIDAQFGKPRGFSLALPEVKPDGFSIQVASLNGCYGYDVGCNWLSLPTDIHLETGVIDTNSRNQGQYSSIRQDVKFDQSFEGPPRVYVWFQEFDYPELGFMRLKCVAENVTASGFTAVIESWAGSTFRNARVQYLAYPAAQDGKRVKSNRELVQRAQKEVHHRNFYYGEPFQSTPKTFIAISELDINSEANTRFRAFANAPNNRELIWSYGTWADTDMDHAAITWIAIE